ncbi:transmembrane protein 154 isoform X2 [Toxotes jaculatrix]|uniref:transmembrane protein 154 isoform X2 n=1 Tax=Toxotes jaculatrix TaxID=941984 RepID=UPI001B3AD758|nr:transmembrane protein 154 isoform X2 [Toxotes jaculatrix]
MSASLPGNMRGPRVKTPLLLLLVLLLTSLTGTVLCQNEDDSETDAVEEASSYMTAPVLSTTQNPVSPEENAHASDQEQEGNSGDDDVTPTYADPESMGSTVTPEDADQNLGFIIIPIFVVLVVVVIGMIVCGIFISRRWNTKTRNQEPRKEDPYLDGASTEKVPMPMFEEDVPSVLELEMEELDQWMKKEGETAGDSTHA